MVSLDELHYLLGSTESLPQIPESPLALARLIESGDPSPGQIEELILRDPALTTAILKVASSALYARPKPISSIREAVTLLGQRSLRALALAAWTTSLSRINRPGSPLTPQRFAQNANAVAAIASTLSVHQHAAGIWNKEELLTAGALHNVMFGLLSYVDANTYSTIHDRAAESKVTIDQSFLMHFGCPLSDLAPRTAQALGLPAIFLDSVTIPSQIELPIDQSQRCLTAAKQIAEGESLGLGNWQTPVAELAMPISDQEIPAIVQTALSRPGIISAA